MKDQKSILSFIDLGFQFAIAIALGVGLGYLLDSKINSMPIFMVLGLLLGAASGFINIYRAVFPKGKNENGKN